MSEEKQMVSINGTHGKFTITWGELEKIINHNTSNNSDRRLMWEPFAGDGCEYTVWELAEGTRQFDNDDKAVDCSEYILESEFELLTSSLLMVFMAMYDVLPDNVKRKITPLKESLETVADNPELVMINSIKEFVLFGSIAFPFDENKPQVEMSYQGRWYPASARFTEGNSMFSGPYGSISAEARIYQYKQKLGGSLFTWDFRDGGRPFNELMEELGVRELRSNTLEKYTKTLDRSRRIGAEYGKQVLISEKIMMEVDTFWDVKLVPFEFGTKEHPSAAIIEEKLESKVDEDERSNGNTILLPYVRIFAPDRKRYVYAHVDTVADYEYDEEAINRLVLPPELEQDLTTVLTCDTTQMFGDVISGKSGGLIIFANGPTGVGKTLTAEVFAEYTKRPLYVMEMGELGTDVEKVEESLHRIFLRAARWDAVLLFDEADVLLAKRAENLERSAIVSVFLRLLDYYKGVMFMTSNRGDIIDSAVKSRITMWVEYPAIEDGSVVKIWENLFEAAKVDFRPGGDMKKLADLPLNGREIRSVVRLVKLLNGNEPVGFDDVKRISQFRPK